jgi:hypothetical protein
MNRLFIYLFALAGLVLWMGCEEEPPSINLNPTRVNYETTYVASSVAPNQPREVMIEYISGVRCPNCPDASLIIKNLKNNYPNRVNSVTIHPNTPSLSLFTRPINKDGFVSKYDFRTDVGRDIVGKLGIPGSLPSGYINRKLYPGRVNRFVERTEWTAITLQEMDSIPVVNIEVSGNTSGEEINADVTLTFTNNVWGDYFLSVMLVEDSIQDVQEIQLNPTTITFDSLYKHSFVLRDMFTANTGEKINGSTIGGTMVYNIERGRVIRKRYSKPLNPAWKRNQLYAIVLVHRGSDEVIVHSKKARLQW